MKLKGLPLVGGGSVPSQQRYMARHEVGFDRCDQGKPRWVPLASCSARRLMNRRTHKRAPCFDGSTHAAISIPWRQGKNSAGASKPPGGLQGRPHVAPCTFVAMEPRLCFLCREVQFSRCPTFFMPCSRSSTSTQPSGPRPRVRSTSSGSWRRTRDRNLLSLFISLLRSAWPVAEWHSCATGSLCHRP